MKYLYHFSQSSESIHILNRVCFLSIAPGCMPWGGVEGQYTEHPHTLEGSSLFLSPQHLCRGVYSFHLFVYPFNHSFVCASVTFMEFTTKFSTKLRESFSSGVYLTNYSSESIHIWTMGTFWKICFLAMSFGPRVHAPG